MKCIKNKTMPNYITLLAENLLLKKKLEIAQNYMKREFFEDKKCIAQQRNWAIASNKKNMFLYSNIEDIVNRNIQSFFWELMLISIPATILENIVSAEITYYNFRQYTDRDGFAVISSYHKALDVIIDECIAKKYKAYIDVNRLSSDIENDALNKSLAKIIHSNYSLSVWRLFHLMETLRKYWDWRNKTKLPQYTYLFFKFLWEQYGLRKVLLEDDDFFAIFKKVIESEVLGSKRHKWKITFVETRSARNAIIWGFKEQNCIIYKLLESEEI